MPASNHRKYAGTPYCRECVDNCHDSELADHWCQIDQWRTEQLALTNRS
ncbi:hypothetical protein ABT282_06975 [Streptomyces sp. NPDC000927]